MRQKLADDAPYTLENLQTLLLVLGEFVNQLHHHCVPPDKQFETLAETQIKSQLHEIFHRWFHNTSGSNGTSAELSAMMTSWAVYGAMSQWSQKDKPEPLPQFVQQVLPLITVNFRPI